MVSRIRVAIVGVFLLVGGGYVFGYAGGAQSILGQVTSAISSAVGVVPLFGSTLASGLNSYVQQQLGADYDAYYDAGIVLVLLGLVAVGWGMRAPKPKKSKAAPMQEQATATPRASFSVQEPSLHCRHCGAAIGAATAFCPVCGRSTT